MKFIKKILHKEQIILDIDNLTGKDILRIKIKGMPGWLVS